MCGIIGVFGTDSSLCLVKKGLKEIQNRGKDHNGFYSKEGLALGHCLHSIVGFVKQPIIGKGVLIANCEIYNWEELNKKYSLGAKNDAEMILLLIEKKGIKNIRAVLDELDGVYAFAYLHDNTLVLARDIIGIKPLWYSHSETFSFASEKKALEKIGMQNVIELNPRSVLSYDIKNNSIELAKRDFFEITPQLKESKEKMIENLSSLITEAVRKRVPGHKFGVLFSGGVDSTFIALTLKKLGLEFTCYVAAYDSGNMSPAEDLLYAKKAAEKHGLKLSVVKIKEKDIQAMLKKIVPLIEDSNVVKVGVALPFYAACKKARKDGCKVIFSGLGSEELFAGYERHKNSLDINKECVSGLLKMYERDTYRDDVITMNNNLELRLPFLDKSLARYALRIPARYKIKGEESKVILREVALRIGVDSEIAKRKKKSAQYGSNFHKALKKLSKKDGHEKISSYLRKFYPRANVKLAALVSSGKDSIYALHVMHRQNYEISCIVTLKSKNPDSYMFHTPAIGMARLQAESMGIPIIEKETTGMKEDELKDLKEALKKAKEKYGAEGIISGALFSNYQRERIEKVADSLQLKIFSPLWHMDQKTEMRTLIGEGFRFIFTKVAADGLDKSWLGKEITEEDVKKLVALNQKNGLHVAGEGGEFESLVLDAPLFSKRIMIKKSRIAEQSENCAELIIEEAELVGKIV